MTEEYQIHLAFYYVHKGEADSVEQAIDELKNDLRKEGKLKIDVEDLSLSDIMSEIIFDGNASSCGSEFQDIELVTSTSEQVTFPEMKEDDD